MSIILLDMDNVLMDFNGRMVEIYNETHEDHVTLDMITHWDFGNLPEHVGKDMDQIWRQPGFFKSLKPLNDALYIVPKLVEEHDCYIASDAFGFSYGEKDYSLETYFPTLKDRKFYCKPKWMLMSDFLLDDKIDTLNKYRIKIGTAVCYNHYHNLWKPDREENWGGLRVSSMSEFYDLVKGI